MTIIITNRLCLAAGLAVLATAAAAPSLADPVTDWNTTAMAATPGSSFMQVRTLAHMHAAVFDAVNAIERRYAPYAVDEKAPPGTSVDAAVAAAAHRVLAAQQPAQQAMLDRALAAALARVADAPGKDGGIALGRRVADRLLALRGNDGATATKVFAIPAAGPGVWQQTPQFSVPIQYAWKDVAPMAIRDLGSYDIGGPPRLDSDAWTRDYEEVKAVGARHSRTRTAEQTAVALYWTVQTLVPWNRAAQAASKAHGLDVFANARLFALLNIAAHDAQIVTIEQKYRYNFWRPYNAIRHVGAAGPAKLAGDASWEPLLNTPGFPDYPSGHCTTSGAALGVLLAFFPDDKVQLSDTHPAQVGITRTWSSFTQMSKEVDDARVWGGIHFRSADEDGSRIGRKVGADVVSLVLRAQEAGAP
jgi:hypothetical protein